MQTILNKLQTDYPNLTFEASQTFFWSPKTKKVFYRDIKDDCVAIWSLFHEVGHALLDHKTYDSDFELLDMEVQAWTKAEELAVNHGYVIDSNHIQDCLDTYRDWLYQRSTCPTCTSNSLQIDNYTYRCFNCATVWHVSSSRMCRPYRRKAKSKQRAINS